MTEGLQSVAEAIVGEFERMVGRDGGRLRLLSAADQVVRIGYRPGDTGPDCADGVCVLPRAELQQLIGETLARRAPGAHVEIEAMA